MWASAAVMASLDEFVESELVTWEVPGCAVVAVRAGSAVHVAGYGTRKPDEDRLRLGQELHDRGDEPRVGERTDVVTFEPLEPRLFQGVHERLRSLRERVVLPGE